MGGAGRFVPRLLPEEPLYSLDSHRIRKEKVRYEGKRHTDTSPRGGSVPDFVEGIYVARKALRSASNVPRQSAHLSR